MTTIVRIIAPGLPPTVFAALAVVLLLAPRRSAAQAPDVPRAEPAAGRIVYTRGEEGVIDIYVAAPDGTDERRLSDIEESSAGEYQPRWSPDASRVAFATTDAGLGLGTFWIVPAEGGTPEAIVRGDGRGLDAAWSPDGRCLAFSGAHAGDQDRLDLKVWCRDEGVRLITDSAAIDEREPDWFPDGTRLLYAARNVGASSNRWRLESIALDGSDRRTVLDRPASHDRQPRFAPDGRRVAFIASDLADLPIGTLSLLELEGGAVTGLVRRPAASFSWSPDGSELLFGNIDNDRVDVLGAGAPLAALAAPERTLQATTAKGLYRLVLATRALSRLADPAGGASAQPNLYNFGFAPDWAAEPATPTPDASPTPTASATRAATATATATHTASPTASPMATPAPAPLFLPLTLRGAALAGGPAARAAGRR